MRRASFRPVCLVAAAAFCFGATAAMAIEETPSNLVELLKLQGRCLKVAIARDDLTSRCSGGLAIAVYEDGRVGFHLTLHPRHILSLSGMHPRSGGGIVVLDRAIFNTGSETNKPDILAASGTCSYGDPYAGRMTVRCSGTLEGGKDFVAAFQTDGSPPAQ